MDLETVNAGFARAMDGDECQLAYCQSELYVEYMLALGGGEAPKKMVAAYAEGPSTEAAIRKVFGVSQSEFESGYKAFLHKQIDAVPMLAAAESENVDELAKAHRQQPGDADVAARLALAYFQRARRRKPPTWPPKSSSFSPSSNWRPTFRCDCRRQARRRRQWQISTPVWTARPPSRWS